MLTVALDVTLTDDLRKEGLARELVNRIQNMRKESGFEVTDKIKIQVQQQQNSLLEQAINSNEMYIKTETLTEELLITHELNQGIPIAFDDIETSILISKIK